MVTVMNLFEQLKADRVTARKAKDAISISILTTLVGELEGIAKRSGNEITDNSVIDICKKFIDNNLITLGFQVTTESADELMRENVVLSRYIPKQLTADELRSIIAASGISNKGLIMKHLKANYNGQYDGTVASKLADTLVRVCNE